MRSQRCVALAPEPTVDARGTYDEIRAFLDHMNDPNVRARSHEELVPYIQKGRMFGMRDQATN